MGLSTGHGRAARQWQSRQLLAALAVIATLAVDTSAQVSQSKTNIVGNNPPRPTLPVLLCPPSPYLPLAGNPPTGRSVRPNRAVHSMRLSVPPSLPLSLSLPRASPTHPTFFLCVFVWLGGRQPPTSASPALSPSDLAQPLAPSRTACPDANSARCYFFYACSYGAKHMRGSPPPPPGFPIARVAITPCLLTAMLHQTFQNPKSETAPQPLFFLGCTPLAPVALSDARSGYDSSPDRRFVRGPGCPISPGISGPLLNFTRAGT